MGHTIAERDKLLGRLRQLKVELASIEQAFKDGAEPAAVLPLVSQSRGTVNRLVTDVIEDHIRIHVLREQRGLPEGAEAAAEALIEVVQNYRGP